MSRYRIVVADQAEAIFYDLASLEKRPREVARISDPVAHQHERDMVSDRPGRSHTRVGSARFAIEREHEPRRQEAARFAKRIARRLDEARRKGEFEDLIVVAGPPFLGVMRAELSRPTRARVVHEVPKDLVHGSAESLRKYLPEASEGLRPA